jgi:hypothetical protein
MVVFLNIEAPGERNRGRGSAAALFNYGAPAASFTGIDRLHMRDRTAWQYIPLLCQIRREPLWPRRLE